MRNTVPRFDIYRQRRFPAEQCVLTGLRRDHQMNYFIEESADQERAERARVVFLQSEVDSALTLLRLAEAEIRGGDACHAAQLISKATLTYDTLLQQLTTVPVDLREEKSELRGQSRRLLDAIRGVERQFQGY
jgi:hypothetical protein